MSPSRASANGFRQNAHPGLQLRRHFIQHRLHNGGHTGHDDDIADPEAGRGRHLVEHEIGTLRDAAQVQARLVDFDAGRGHALLQDRKRPRIDVDGHAERLGDAIGGDVIVVGANAAGGEYICIAVPQRVERIDDRAFFVWDDAEFPKIDAECCEIFAV